MISNYKDKNIEICFYFPEITKVKPQSLSALVLQEIKVHKNENYLGYSDLDMFKKDLNFKFGDETIKEVCLKKTDKDRIEKCIKEFQDKFEKELKLKYKPIRFFVFPWYPSKTESKKFGGITAVATYFTVIHLFVDIKEFSLKSLRETLAHELNHLYFYQANNKFLLNIQESIILEGLAEHFCEYFVGGRVAPWSKALNEKEILKILPRIQTFYGSSDFKVHNDIFYGSKDFKRWTGYSIGYFLVKKFSEKNKDWKRLMTTKVQDFFRI